MRGHHKAFIDYCNSKVDPFYEKTGRKEWTLTRPLFFKTPYGDIMVPEAGKSDLFSCVPDTQYLRVHQVAILHDYARTHFVRFVADAMFSFEFSKAVADILHWLIEARCPEKVRDKEIVRLQRVQSLYMLGISGKVGSVYIWLDKLSGFWKGKKKSKEV